MDFIDIGSKTVLPITDLQLKASNRNNKNDEMDISVTGQK